VVDDEKVARDIICSHLVQVKRIEVVASCSSAVEAFNKLNEHKIDLIFLDINMPQITGLSFAKTLNKEVKVIFTTAHREYAIEGFELQALDYLLKPVSFERLFKAVNHYFDVFQKPVPVAIASETKKSVDHFFVKADRKMVRIDLNEIRYVESFKDYLKIHSNNATIVTRETISNIEQRLPADSFFRIHRSFIVAVNFITSFSSDTIELDQVSLPISRSYREGVSKRLNY
jgi:DNA-binding LytR/AlgR family response regulator